tara:strand:- start:218 stop:535 length:318 start_codon:yes stop_codon:yes gene_type:complete
MIDIKELKRILQKEESKEVWRRVELSNANLEISKLKEQIKRPDYYKKQHIPVTDLVQIQTADREELRLDNMMRELDGIALFAIGLVVGVSGLVFIFLLICFMAVA